MRFYDHKCNACGAEIEDNNPSPPLCPNGHGLMVRKFTPSFIVSSNLQTKAQGAHETAYYQEQEAKKDKNVKRIENNKAVRRRSLRKYCAADFHNRHGIGIDGVTKSARKIEAMK